MLAVSRLPGLALPRLRELAGYSKIVLPAVAVVNTRQVEPVDVTEEAGFATRCGGGEVAVVCGAPTWV